MPKKVIIAEKPSVGREYAKALHVTEKKDGYMESNEWIVTWSFGHLIQLCYPEEYDAALKKWELDTLPFLPEKYKYEVIKNVKDQFNTVKKLYNRKDVTDIYYAGDSGREGLYIQMLIRMVAGHNPDAAEHIVWIDSQTEEEILRGIREAKGLHAYTGMKSAGFVRAIEDYATGINFSRVLSILYGQLVNNAAATKKYHPISVGRVMTCVLGMVVERERELRNFKPTPYYRIESRIPGPVMGEWKAVKGSAFAGSPKLYSDIGFLKEEDAGDFILHLPDRVTISSAKQEEEKKYAPLLFNLAELQGECSKRFHISPQETLNVAQSLYEKKMTTYPRTDARVLTTAIQGELGKNLGGLAKNPAYSGFVETIKTNGYKVGKKYVDDKKVTDHYAIIPTGLGGSGLSELEQDVYDLITRRFLAIYYPPAVYRKVSIVEDAGGEKFFAHGKALQKMGYMEVSGRPKGQEDADLSLLEEIKEGATYQAKYSVKKGETQPPKRYTTGSMVLAMENAGKLIEDEELREQIISTGIGTSATRAETIEKLIRLTYLSANKKTQVLTPTNFGEMIYEVVALTIPSLLSPKMTASWEKGLQRIADRKMQRKEYEDVFFKYVREQVANVKSKDISEQLKENIRPFMKKGAVFEKEKFEPKETGLTCPKCGAPLMTSRWGFACSKYNKDGGCTFSIGEVAGYRLSEEQAKDLLDGKTIGPVDGLKSKKGKKFSSMLYFDKESMRVCLKFEEEKEIESSFACPICGNLLKLGKWAYSCECGFKIGHTIAGKKLSAEDMEKLLADGETDTISGFKSKKGKKFNAKLRLNGQNIEFIFDK